MIVEKQGGSGRAKYGDGLIKELSIQLTKDFGSGYTPRNLWYMKQLYLIFPKVNTVCAELDYLRCQNGIARKKPHNMWLSFIYLDFFTMSL